MLEYKSKSYTQKSVIESLRTFAHHHDDLPAFHAGYLVLTLLAAAMLNLGVFAVLILIHMSLDVVKYREYHQYSWRMTYRGMMKENLVDIALLSVGLVFSVYLHHSVGVASLSGLMRAEATLVRAAATIIPKMKILQNFLKVMSHLRHYIEFVHPGLHTEWTSADRLQIFFILVAVVLIAIAPWVMSIDMPLFQQILFEELIPWHL